MKLLLLLRHAEAAWNGPRRGDYERPLTDRGCRDATSVGRWLLQEKLVPQRMIGSAALRARTTTRLVADACAYGEETLDARELYLAGPREYLRFLGRLESGVSSVMLVGHNPGLEELLELLTGSRAAMPTAGLAWIELAIASWEELWPGVPARLIGLRRPGESES